MDVSKVLENAWAAVEGANLPVEVRPDAFREAVRLLAPLSAPSSSPHSVKSGGSETRYQESKMLPPEGNGSGPSEDEIYARVVAQTGVEREKLERAVYLDDDAIRVSLPGLKLGKNNAERARAVAQLLTVVRGFGLEESETSLEVIRAECERLKVYDSANFSSHMKGLSGFVVTGTGQNRKVRAKGPGIQAFPALIGQLLGEQA